MKRLLCFLALFVSLGLVCQAQTSAPTQIVKKFNGETTTFTWEFDTTEEFLITHFSLRAVDDLTKTTVELKTIPKTLRGTAISASFTPNLKFMYYNVVAVNNSVTPIQVSDPSNTVATERVGKPPKNLVGQ